VTVRYFAAARAAVGLDHESVDLPSGTTVAALRSTLAERHGDRLARVLAASSFLVDEITTAPDRVVPDGALVDVLPPFAGG
jgi:sulfur-carrier protein